MSEGLMFRSSVGTPLSTRKYTPGKEDIIIPKGNFLTGDQIIKGDPNLIPHNIVKGTTIFGVTGDRRPNDLMIYTGEEEPETKVGLWVPCGIEITTIVFAPEYNIGANTSPEGTLVLPISTYNLFQLSEMMPVVYSSAPYVYKKGELIRFTTAKIGNGVSWEPFDISIPLIQNGIVNTEFFGGFRRFFFCQTPNYPTAYSTVNSFERNGVLTLYFNQRSSHNVYVTWVSDMLIDLSRFSKVTVNVKSLIEYNVGGLPTAYQSFAGAKIGFKSSPSSTAINNFRAVADIDPSVETYTLDVSYLESGYLSIQLNAYEYGAITLDISSVILG